jgi:hypothetical protein
MKRCFVELKGHVKSLFVTWASKKRLFRFPLSDFLSRGMALGTHNLPSGRLNKRFGEVDEAMFLGVRVPSEIKFCILGIKKATFTESFKYDLSRRVALRTHNLPCGLLKKRFWFRRRSVVSRC